MSGVDRNVSATAVFQAATSPAGWRYGEGGGVSGGLSREGDASRPGEVTVGAIVSLRADPSRTGPVILELPAVGGQRRFRVYHSHDVIRDYVEDQLQPQGAAAGGEWTENLLHRNFADPLEFRARLTALRLDNPQVDHIYSLRSARIQFIPFQFKPLLRLLRADRPRLLIADDVGVGKTIEAGLILKELSTRQRLDRILVLCPKALTVKWRAEMRRFDENFRVLTAQTLRYCLDETANEGQWPQEYARSIVHYELFRMEPYLVGTDRRRHHRGLLELEPPAQFDLVIADEAHHVRTPGAGGYQLVDRLCQTAEAVLMLSATPVQVHRDNLFALLHLLRPELFPDRDVFADVLEPNPHLVTAARLLRGGPDENQDWIAVAAKAINDAGQTRWGHAVLRSDPRYLEVAERLTAGSLDDEDRVRSIRDLEELHSLAHVMNRTRRRDIGKFTIREPRTVSVDFTPEQRRLYDAVLEFRREVLLQDYSPQVVRLILDTLERQAESCINAIGYAAGQILETGGLSVADLTDDPEVDDLWGEHAGGMHSSQSLLAPARNLMAAADAMSDDDPKFDKLSEIVTATLEERAGPGKVLVFSFFLNTIDYLRQRLEGAGIRTGVVTGRVEDEEREELRDRFRLDRKDPNAIDVLVSSEVGCEGLDYEFCDRLGNYDIPWNPMRIEQRIGRIDRFGQRSERVLIFNFITPDTVAERVFFRCFERLGVFRDTVGDLEEVLGEVAQGLNRIAFDPALSPEQAAAQARQIADNAIRLTDEQRRMDTESDGLLGLDDAFTEEVEDVVESGRFVAESDLRTLIEAFIGRPFLQGRLTQGRRAHHLYRLRLGESGRRELVSRIQALDLPGNQPVQFVRAVEDPGGVVLTFDQQTAVSRRDIAFVTPVHPLARAAVNYWTHQDEPLLGAFTVATDQVPPGLYVFACEVWETIAVRPDLRLVCLVVSAGSGAFAPALSKEFMTLLPAVRALDAERVNMADASVARCLAALDSLSDGRRREAVRGLEASNGVLLDRKLASLETFHEHRRVRVSAELAAASESRIIRMKTSELSRIQEDFAQRKAVLERAREADILSRRVAAGLIEVTSAS
jgi:superfamily II DNA or RNA helicase